MLDARMVRPIARPGHSTIMATFRSCETAPVEAADQTERRADHEGDEDGERAAHRAGAAAVQQPGQVDPADAVAAEQRRGAAHGDHQAEDDQAADGDRVAQGAAPVGGPAAPRPWGLDSGHEIRTFGLSRPYAMSSGRLTIQHLS
ncbi:hypothetical protein OG568_03830 [Streptomyces sp. NBC_01450]|uniref:hypothetical protein n=1 Tax=Streptomyces sp. NBC_01450 TaxID=2903871 RepID=UPI002E325899|nr:hypothetical protein [Streptomyces sp. NBC_01450]